jgi:hypothetical protein
MVKGGNTEEIMRKLMLVTLLFPLACKGGFSENTGWNPAPPADGGDPKAQALIDQVWAAMGVMPSYKTFGELRYTWDFYDNGSLKKSENFYWNRFEHRMRWEETTIEGNMIAVRTDLENHHGRAYSAKRNQGLGSGLQQAAQAGTGAQGMGQFQQMPSSEFPRLEDAAFKSFRQSRRWLLGPLMLRDKGVHVKYSEDSADCIGPDKKKYLALVVTFDDAADWDNKKDKVIWQIDPDTKLPVWMLWQQGGKEGVSAWSQEDWKDIGGGVKLPLDHKQYSTTIEMKFANVQLNPRPDDDLYFESVK